MSLNFTPENVASVYECLRTFKPFSHWNLPPCDEVIFRVIRAKDCQGQYRSDVGGQTGHQIDVSELWVGQLYTLIELIAHEMIHMRQSLTKTDRGGLHNQNFRQIARQVCRRFNWDYKQFITS